MAAVSVAYFRLQNCASETYVTPTYLMSLRLCLFIILSLVVVHILDFDVAQKLTSMYISMLERSRDSGW